MVDNEKQIERQINDIALLYGAEVVELKILPVRGDFIVRCSVDLPCGGINIDDCVKINEKIYSFLDTTKALGDNFSVEVNSPGLDRLLKNYKDFLRTKGKRIMLWLQEPVLKKEYYEGDVFDINDERLILKVKDSNIEIKLNQIKVGKLAVKS